ncbi:AsmA family protein, partial [uncultured Aquabacterium sp.]|uniref:YhdP family protein n=1 Tax=uncultured Aquabacterium sp. TaxID=158753 RepID=UPI0030D1FB91
MSDKFSSPDDGAASPDPSASPRKPSGRWLGRAGSGLLKATAWGVGGLVMLMVVAWAVLLWAILPRVDGWRADLTQQATKALGLKVEIGQVRGRADGIWPTLALQDVRLLDADGRVALSLPEVQARLSLTTLSPQALLDGELRLDRLTLVRPALDIRRDAAGDIHIAGLKLPAASATSADSGGGLDWVLSQSRIDIRQGTVRWSDDWMRAPTLALRDVDVKLRSRPSLRGRVHELDVAATPPEAFGQRFELHGAVSQPLWLVGRAP